MKKGIIVLCMLVVQAIKADKSIIEEYKDEQYRRYMHTVAREHLIGSSTIAYVSYEVGNKALRNRKLHLFNKSLSAGKVASRIFYTITAIAVPWVGVSSYGYISTTKWFWDYEKGSKKAS